MLKRASALYTLIHQRHPTPSCGGHAPTAERTMNPARMCLESLDRRPGIREQPGSNSEVRARNWAGPFTLKNRHRQPGLSCPKSTNDGVVVCKPRCVLRGTTVQHFRCHVSKIARNTMMDREHVKGAAGQGKRRYQRRCR